MRRFFGSMGSISRITIENQALKNNMAEDPSVRVVACTFRRSVTDGICADRGTIATTRPAMRYLAIALLATVAFYGCFNPNPNHDQYFGLTPLSIPLVS